MFELWWGGDPNLSYWIPQQNWENKDDKLWLMYTLFVNIAQITSLQVIDNVIVVHNFERCESIIIDIKSDNVDKILCNKIKLHS